MEAPLSPILSNSKHSKKYIARRRSKMKLNNSFLQNSLVSQEKCSESKEISQDVSQMTNENYSQDSELELRLKRCLEIQRSKKFCYNIAASTSTHLNPETTIFETESDIVASTSSGKSDCVFKIPESSTSQVKSVQTSAKFGQNISASVGFETVSGKKIILSDKVLKRSAKLFEDIFDSPLELSNIICDEKQISALKTTDSKLPVNLKTYRKKQSKKIENLSPVILETSEKVTSNKIETRENCEQFKTFENVSPDNKNASFTQITDTQICWAAENAECMADFLNSQWTTSPKEKHKHNLKTNSQNDHNFNTQETETFFGNLTVCEDGTIASRTKHIDKEIGFSLASGKKITISEESMLKSKILFDDIDKQGVVVSSQTSNIETKDNQSESSHKYETSDCLQHLTLQHNQNLNDFNGFSWEDCLKSLQITELYTSCIKVIEKDVKNDNLYPFSLTFDNIFHSKQYQNKNYKYSLRRRRKNVNTNINKRKSVRLKQKHVEKIIGTPEISITSSGNKRILTDDCLSSFISQNNIPKAKKYKINVENFQKISKKINFKESTNTTENVEERTDYKEKEDNILTCTETNNLIEVFSEKNNFENIETNLQTCGFGFTTTSGKQKKISKESLEKAKLIFSHTNDLNSEICQNAGFSTASGKTIQISEENLKKSKEIFRDCDITETCSTETGPENTHIIPLKISESRETLNSGFSTASGSKINISDKLLQKSKNIFQDIDFMIEEKPEKSFKNVETFGFAKASGKKINLSEESLQRAKKLFQDLETFENDDKNDSALVLEKIKQENIEKNSSFGGFCTAKGKKLEISELSYKKVQNLFDNCDVIEKDFETKIDISKNNTSFGFSTVSGKKITVSDESLKKAKSVLQDCNENVPKNIEIPKVESNLGFFSLASGKTFKISDDAMKKAQNLFDDLKELDVNVNSETFEKQTSVSNDCYDHNSEKQASSFTNEAQVAVDVPKLPRMPQKSFLSPQTPSNLSSNLSIINSKSRYLKKRSLGVNSCRQLNISDNNIKKAKSLFEDIETPKKTTINNNIQHYTPSKTPEVLKNVSNFNKSYTNIPEVKLSQNLVSKLSPVKNNCDISEKKDENSRFSFRKHNENDGEKQKNDFQKELQLLKLKINVIETRMNFLDKQKDLIENGSREHRRQRPGYLFIQKTQSENRVSLLKAVNNRRPEKNTQQICLNIGLEPNIIQINAQNAVNLNFYTPCCPNSTKTYPAVLQTDDGGFIIPNQQDYVGVTQIEQSFLSLPGVDPNLVPKNWVTNHFRWIVWKLASLERNFVDLFKNCLTIESVMGQLKYRYDREIDRAERSAVRKIFECDDSAAKRMVLCVATIIKLGENKCELELTDSWYSIKTVLDPPLNALIDKNLIKIGQKLVIQGAELLNCEGCSPLELRPNVRLQIHYNSTRRAAWYVKLGYQSNPGPLVISLRTIHGAGGPVGGVCVYVTRCYPITYMERHDETVTWRNQRAELKKANQWEATYSNTMETMQIQIVEELEKEWGEKQKKDKNKWKKIKNVNDIFCGETLFNVLEESNDPDSIKELFTAEQYTALQEYQLKLNSERQTELNSRLKEKLLKEKIEPRNVASVLKLLVLDVGSPYHHRIFSIWRPTESHSQILKEGAFINIYNILAKNNGSLSSTPRTQFDIATISDTSKFELFDRTITSIAQTSNPNTKTHFGEFDTVGIVISVDVQLTNQTIWLADENYRFLLIKIRDGPETCCLFDGIMPGKIIAITNLIFQKPFRNFGEALGNCYTSLTSYPQQTHLQDYMKEFIEKLAGDVNHYLEECKERVEELTSRNLQRSFVLNPVHSNTTKNLENKLCGLENSQKNNADSPTLSDEEMALINSQLI